MVALTPAQKEFATRSELLCMSLITKNSVARVAVFLAKKLPEPVDPNKVFDFALTSSSIPTIKKRTCTVCKYSAGALYVSSRGCQKRGDIKV